ncbi:MAG: phosphatase PAP2 family protein [Anaerolineales bacterium]|nr:phosphatase PAP2 family protein [Anaerolineales bacterium]
MASINRRSEQLDHIAKAISDAFHPFVVVIPTMVIAMVAQGSALWQALVWTVLSVCIVILPLLVVIYAGVRSGRFSDASISVREQRSSLYTLAAFLLVLLLVILVLGKAPLILIACLISAVLATVTGFAINQRFTKLSLHSIGMAGCATVLLLVTPWLGLAMVIFALLVGWARIRLKHHTPLQILIGWMVSVFSVLIIFYLFL